MIKRHWGLVTLLLAMAAPVWATQSPMGLATAFGALPQRSLLTLSPSGRMLAWMQRSTSGRAVVVYDIATRKVPRVVRFDPNLTLEGLYWENDNTLLMRTQATAHLPAGYGWRWSGPMRLARVMALNIATGKTHILLAHRLIGTSMAGDYVANTAQLLAWHIPQRPHTVIMSGRGFSPANYRQRTGTLIHNTREDSGNITVLYAVSTRTGKGKPIAFGDAYTDSWVLAADGSPVARSEWRSHRYSIYALRSGHWRQIYQAPEGVRAHLWGFDPKLQGILVYLPGHSGPGRVWVIPLDGSAPSPMLPGAKSGVQSVAFSRYTHKLTGAEIGGFEGHWRWLDIAAQLRYESVARAFPGKEVQVYDPSQDGGVGLAKVEGPDSPPVYYFINFVTHHAMIAGAAYPQLVHVALGAAHSIHYRMPDGQTVHAEVFLPPGAGKDLPLVVFAPGDLAESGSQSFDWFAQYLAASGYAVLRPEIRQIFLSTEGGPIYWGGASQRYAVDGIRLLVKRGVADPHRVCIVGGGYGGYAALAGAAFFPNTYACAASIDGFADLPSLLGTEITEFGGRNSDHAVLADWRIHVGSRFDPKVAAESPLHAAQAVVASVLLIHDERDTVVPFGQSVEMARALKKLGKPVTFIKLKGDDHYLTRAHARIKVLKAVGAFLQKSLGRAS